MTTKRFWHVRELVHLREMLIKYPEQSDRLVKEAILYSLPPAYIKLYEWIRQGAFHGRVHSNAVCHAWGWKQNYASTALNELWQFGLLKRTECIDQSGKHFAYEVVE